MIFNMFSSRMFFSNLNSATSSICSQNFSQYDSYQELKQEKHLARNLVKQILYSRRLLIDHVESLENILFEVEQNIPKHEIFTLANISMVSSLGILLNLAESIVKPLRYGAMLIGGGFGCMYFYKSLRKVQNTQNLNRVEKLIQCISSFGNSVKKNISYFNELLFMRSGRVTIEDIHYKRAWGCIQAVKTATEILFYATRYLEGKFPLSVDMNDVYSPIEDLNTCHYFTRPLGEFSPQNIKDFYNIFAYIQSQFLFRLALSIAENPTTTYLEKDLPRIINQIQAILSEEEKSFLKISSALRQRRAEDRAKLRRAEENRHCAPTAVLKDISLKLTSSIVAVAEECEKLDGDLQDIVDEGGGDSEYLSNIEKRTKLLNMADTIRAVELSLSTCNDDFQRLVLIYNKYILNKLASSNYNPELPALPECETSNNYEHLKSLSLADVEIDVPKGDDYFAYSYEDRIEASDDEGEYKKYADYQLYNLEKKISKNRFKPVLKQLKSRINPIRENMLKTEREVLEAKGIDVNKFYDEDYADGDRIHEENESNHSDNSEEIERNERPVRTDKYNDVREFLAQKAPVNLYNLRPLPSAIYEDVIE